MSEETKLHEVAVAWRPEKGDAIDQITREVRSALDQAVVLHVLM